MGYFEVQRPVILGYLASKIIFTPRASNWGSRTVLGSNISEPPKTSKIGSLDKADLIRIRTAGLLV